MTTLPIHLDSTHRVKAAPTVSVWWRQDWQDEWEAMTWTELELLDRGCSPQIDRCILRRRYGYISRNTSPAFRVAFPYQTSIIGSYVKLLITPDLLTVANSAARLALRGQAIGSVVYESGTDTVYRFLGPLKGEATPGNWTAHEIGRQTEWYGVITNMRRDAMGGDVLGEAGDQVIEALGMEVLFTRKQITTTVIEDADLPVPPGVSTITIERGLPFNGHRGDRDRGTYATANKSPYPDANGDPVFSKTLTAAENWNATEIVEYLLAQHRPTEADGPQFILDFDAASILNAFVPIDVQTDGRTVFDVLNAVIDRRRGVLWWIEPYWADEALLFMLRVETSEIIAVDLPSGATIAANQHVRSLAIDSVADLQNYSEQYDGFRKYNQVIVEGGRQGAVFTLAIADNTLEEDWTATEEGLYKTAAATEPGYNVLDRSHQATLNDNVRTSDALRHVYTRFRVPDDWDGKAGDGSGGEKYHVFPVLSEMGSAPADKVGHQFWNCGLRFQNHLPLKAQWKYYDTGYTPEDRNRDGTTAEFRRPFAVVTVPTASGADEWFFADAAGVATALDELRGGTDQRISCTLKMHDEQPGVSLTPNGPSHAMSGNTVWDGSDPTRTRSHLTHPPTDYERTKFTVYALADAYVTSTYPSVMPEVENNQQAVHVIRLGDRARVDYVAPGTIVEVSAGQLKRTDRGMFARDDRELMRDLARSAWLWYGTTRIAIDMAVGHVTNQVRLGDLIGQVTYGYRFMTTTNGTVIMFGGKPWLRAGSTDRVVNSAVTRIAWNFLRGSTSLTTDYAAIDFEQEAFVA